MNNKEILEKFGKILTEDVRDTVFRQFLKAITGEMISPSSKKIRNYLKDIPDDQLENVRETVLSVLDSSLHYFLWMIEQSDDFDLVTKEDDKIISLKEISDGLCGEPHGEEGWFAKYSKYPSTLV